MERKDGEENMKIRIRGKKKESKGKNRDKRRRLIENVQREA